jgi:hypothetical protein
MTKKINIQVSSIKGVFSMNIKLRYIGILILLSFIIGTYTEVSAQMPPPLVTAQIKCTSKAYVPLTSYNWSYGPYSYYSYYYQYALPFNFYYDGQNMKYITMSGSGALKLQPTSGGTYYVYKDYASHWDGLYSPNYYKYVGAMIYPFYGFYYYDVSGTNYRYYMYIYTSGTAPNRVTTFEWKNFGWYYSQYQYGTDFSCQVRLYETSNEIEIHYGNMTRGSATVGSQYSSYWYTALIGLTGYYPTTSPPTNNYINLDPNGNGTAGLGWEAGTPSKPLSRGYTAFETVRANGDLDNITIGECIRISYGPNIVKTQPTADVNLRRGYVYGNGTNDPGGYGNNQRPSITLNNIAGGASVRRRIEGPISYPASPNFQIIYDATETALANDVARDFANKTTLGNNIAFGNNPPYPNGSLDLKTSVGSISGGMYRVYDDITHNAKVYNNEYFINIANDWDMLIRRIVQPKSLKEYVYAAGEPIPVKIKVANKGLNNVKRFYLLVDFYNSANELVHHDSIYWQASIPSEEMKLGDEIDIDFPSWNTMFQGIYKLKAYCYLQGDQETFNNYWAWLGSEDHYFKVAPEIEAETNAILEPTDVDEGGGTIENTVGRPIRPRVRYQNNGKNDISDVPTTVVIRHLGTGQEVYRKQNIKVVGIPAGIYYNTVDWLYDFFTPTMSGKYEIKATVNSPDDFIEENNELIDTFTVIDPLLGTYTIGPAKNTGNNYVDSVYNSRNFTNIQVAVDALYWKGVGGPVVFELTNNTYDVGVPVGIGPALDLRTRIEGISPTNTVTFKPTATLSSAESNIVINLYSPSGVGIIFGQSQECFNHNAIFNYVPESIRKLFTSPTGNIIFDGGKQRAFKFLLHTTSEWNAVFYLSQGASNITVKNCVITTANPAASWNDVTIPKVAYANPVYYYERDWRTIAAVRYSYSAGIVMRSIAPMDEISFWNVETDASLTGNRLNLDTLMNSNNTFTNNKISGFAYGIVSMGVGSCIVSGIGKHLLFYNHDNLIADNHITQVSRAGIFMGFERNTTIRGNKIYAVASSTTGYYGNYDVAGIILGGERTSVSDRGYNNIGLIVDGNEISNVGQALTTPGQNRYVYGIKADQQSNAFGTQTLPEVDEELLIKNNVIWGLRPGVADANKIGIRLFTERSYTEPNWLTKLYTPQNPSYFTRHDKIVNNTILIDNDGFTTTGIMAPIMLQNASNALVMNNAIALKDNNGGVGNNIYAGIFCQGILPGKAGDITSDRNVLYLNGAGDDQPALYWFTEIDLNSNIINMGTRSDFVTLNQWQMFSGNDIFSVIDDFTDELTTPNIEEQFSELRIKSLPSWPKGSKLNNRGENLPYVASDIDGNTRGLASQRCDIGAIEFPGILLTTDAEISSVQDPGSYRSTTSVFSDAEYVMTEAPVDIKAVIRNNGSLQQTGLKVYLKIYRENPATPGDFYPKPELEEMVQISLESAESGEVSFNLNDKTGKEFYPLSYGDWFIRYTGTNNDPDSLYTMPSWYSTMENNVTPLYKIVVSLQSDEEINNNVFSKVVRFYIKRSLMGLLVTAENTYNTITGPSSADIKAGRRNYDSLVAGFASLGYINGWDTTGEFPILNQYYDVFERSAWEPRAVNYGIYKTVFWSDADENILSRFEKEDLEKFLATGTESYKRNLVLGSQEMFRLNYPLDSAWVKRVLSAKRITVNPTDPNAGAVYATQDNPARYIIGETIERTRREDILKTNAGIPDPDPVPALMSLYTDGEGLTRSAYNYNVSTVICPTPKEVTAGTASVAIKKNVLYLGIDWRHFGTMSNVMRAIIDFLNKNGGSVIPVELVAFNAKTNDNRVEISWETAGEINSSRFEIERADISAAGYGSFVKIGEEKAAGKSNKSLTYGPVVDKGVSYGNSYAYRLKMIDLDGKYTYSEVVEVTVGAIGTFTLSDAIPNPAGNETTIEFTIAEGSDIQLAIFDITGKNVMTIANGAIASGSYLKRLDVSGLANGYYNIVMNINGMTITRQLRIVR